MIIKKPYLLLLLIISIYTLFKIFLDFGDESHVAVANANDESHESIVRRFTMQHGDSEFDEEDERLRRLRQHDYIRDSGHRQREKTALVNDYNSIRSRNSTKNHTLMKANIRDVIHILNNLKKIEIDPRQMQIYNKYKHRHDSNATTNDTLQQSPDDTANSSQQSQQKQDRQYIISHPFSSDKIDPKELDRLLRARTDVVHPHPFKYLINSPEICAPLIPSYSPSTNQNDGNVYILIYVHTSPGNYRRREVIRRTWGNCVQYAPDVSVRIVFVMGVHPEPDENKAKSLSESLRLEQDLYGDLVQEDFIDSYHNLTYKGVAALKWISLFCPNARFILKTDDDIFVNMFSLIKYFKHLEKDENNLKGLIMCAVWYGMPVLRTGKWKLSIMKAIIFLPPFYSPC
ncbi:hypothetical protein HELRODRAFT_189122 [Helobdella robusta]|uniref:Hexosyltransferase n=1 Tax=Helobdella robusta TaxID=6412 RepID=T1FQP4_HELRO|nr:hypothetical protein HELRODRAFT_189122 [Helobdella robusta]ESN96139.1 hypothetical protein HELRODRAFT_189122 [Helobdella robusta]